MKRTIFVSLRTKLVAALGIIFLLAFAAIYYWLYGFVTDLAMNNLQANLIATAKTAASGIEGDTHLELFKNGTIDNPTYTAIASFLRSIKKTNPQASGMYTFISLPDEPGKVRLVVSAALPPGSTDQSPITPSVGKCKIVPSERPSLGEVYTDTSPAMLAGVKTAGADNELWTDTWGTWLSGYAPIFNSKNEAVGAVGVDMCAQDVISLQQNIRRNTLIAFGISLLVLLGIVGLLATGVTRPVMELTRAVDRIGNGDYTVDFSSLYNTRVQDEVDKLANAFNQMTIDIKKGKQKLEDYSSKLEQQVEDRTSTLSEKMKELEQMNKFMVDRELKMVELKKEIEKLKRERSSRS